MLQGVWRVFEKNYRGMKSFFINDGFPYFHFSLWFSLHHTEQNQAMLLHELHAYHAWMKKVLQISVRPTCAIFYKCKGFKDIKYDIPVFHEGHEGHEDISAYLHFSCISLNSLHFSTFPFISLHFSEFRYISLHLTAFLCISLHFSAFLWISLNFSIFPYISLHLTAFLCISLHSSPFLCISLQFIIASWEITKERFLRRPVDDSSDITILTFRFQIVKNLNSWQSLRHDN